MSWSITQKDLEHFFGLTEVAMIRLPLKEWASEEDMKKLEAIATSEPLPEDWPELQCKIARKSYGFIKWMQNLATKNWKAEKNYINEKLQKIDFSMPWCTRLRWGARNLKNVDIFIHVTVGTSQIAWETI